MSSSSSTTSFQLANQVHTSSLVPQQQSTPISFQRKCDFYQQCFIKHPGRSDFHSRAEHLHAALLEGNPKVTCFVPQPFMTRLNGSRYKPDCYVLEDSMRKVQELKPKGIFDDAKRIPLEQFFSLNGMQFEVVSNESVFEHEIEAENWIDIVRTLYIAKELDTQNEEIFVLDYCNQYSGCAFGDIVDPGDREGTFYKELALLRLLHRGLLHADLTDLPLDYDTRITLCT